MQYFLPKGMRYATLEERQQFYTQEFDTMKVAAWFGDRLPYAKFAVIMGRHTKIVLPQYQDDADTTIIIDDYTNISDIQAQIVDFLPEAVYYDRNLYGEKGEKLGQELAFDLDPENVTCPVHGTLADKMAAKQGLSFCELELDIIRKKAIGLYEYLQTQFFNLAVTYSGRGFHVHVMDKDAYSLTPEKRLKIAQEVKAQGFPIDEWVTSGEYRLIRLPYSLNGLVSRIVIPLKKSELESFNPITDSRCLPKFLGQP